MNQFFTILFLLFTLFPYLASAQWDFDRILIKDKPTQFRPRSGKRLIKKNSQERKSASLQNSLQENISILTKSDSQDALKKNQDNSDSILANPPAVSPPLSPPLPASASREGGMGLTSSLGYLYFSSDSNSYNPSIDNGFALFQGKARFPTGGIHRIEFDYLTTLSSQIAAGVGSLEDEGVQWSQQTLSYFFKTSQERFSLFVGSLIREDVLWSERQTKTIYGQTRTQAGLTSRWLIRNTSALEECLDFSLIPWGRRENIDQQGMETEVTWNRQGTAENGQAWTFGLGFSRGEWRSLQQSWTQTKSFIHLGLSWSSF